MNDPNNTQDAMAAFSPAACYAAGDAVEVCDHSEAHGDKGKVMWTQKDGLIIVELESGCCWPLTAEELKPHNSMI
jgi:hypothetical protein